MQHAITSRSVGADWSALRQLGILGGAVSCVLLGVWLFRAWHRPLEFDDAYMFYRYGLNILHGHGVSWNPDGVPTYGLTSQLWVWLLLPFVALPLTPAHALQLASWLAGTAGLAMLTAAVVRHAQSDVLRSPLAAFGAVALSLLVNFNFYYHLTTGMETMLSLWANAALVYGVVQYAARPDTSQAFLVGSLGFLAILVRPDNGICALGSPLLAWLMIPGKRRWGDLAGLGALPLMLFAVELLVCKWYFHVALPLGFYAKSLHNYAGFLSQENGVAYADEAVRCAIPFAGILIATVRRKNLPLVAALALPALATSLYYLLALRQIMGLVGRYYIPLLPFVVLPALLCADQALVEGLRPLRRMAFGVAAGLAIYVGLHPFERKLERAYLDSVMAKPIAVPSLPAPAREPLPTYDVVPVARVVGPVIANLPAGAVVAASEVGYLGCIAPQATVIDLVGLNDTRIGTLGFSMDDLLSRAPDLIWLPNSDYTGLRAAMLTDRRLFARYIVIVDVFNFGVAIRRDSPLRGQIERGLQAAWSKLYSSGTLSDYTVPDGYAGELTLIQGDEIGGTLSGGAQYLRLNTVRKAS